LQYPECPEQGIKEEEPDISGSSLDNLLIFGDLLFASPRTP